MVLAVMVLAVMVLAVIVLVLDVIAREVETEWPRHGDQAPLVSSLSPACRFHARRRKNPGLGMDGTDPAPRRPNQLELS
jgi:hypothetical protein